MTETVLYEVTDAVASVTLNRPERLNAINPALLGDLTAALMRANADPTVHAIILRGAGRAFCAGDDLKEFDSQVGTETETRAYIELIQDVTRALCLNRKMVIGAIHGWAVGGGLEWVINCDFVIMSRDARFFFPEISLGIFVTGAVTRLLTQQVGLQKARRMILLGEQYSANDASELGFDWQVVDPDMVDDEARALAQRIAALPVGPVGDLKQALREAADTNLEGAMAIETQATLKGFLDPDSAQRARDRLG
jgi:enoyl-CoA hydratase/carnithine racemase